MTQVTDVGQLQNMVKKRDEIIAELVERAKLHTMKDLELIAIKDQDADAISIDYEELVHQLKAATGEITRLEGELTDCKTFNSELIEKNKAEVAAFGLTIAKLESQLDQECNSNAELEDKMGNLANFKSNKDETQIRVLEEKLAMCDGAYKKQAELIAEIAKKATSLLP